MTSERDTNDPRVSEAYRQLASEETPGRLDDKVLAMAAQEARTRYGVVRAWMRPVAWAATIGLSLAFLLEISQLDDTASPVAGVPLPAAAPETARSEADVAMPEPIAEPARNDADLLKVKDQAETRQGTATRTRAAQELTSADMPMLDEAEEQARIQSRDAPPAAANFAVAAEKKERPGHCSDAEQATAEAWFACIEELRAAGRIADAGQELDALLSRFPDFKAPAVE